MTAIDHRTDVATIEHLDFDPTIPCEHPQHDTHHADEPAMFLAEYLCTQCPRHIVFSLCLSGWEQMSSMWCRGCFATVTRDETTTILRVIGGPR